MKVHVFGKEEIRGSTKPDTVQAERKEISKLSSAQRRDRVVLSEGFQKLLEMAERAERTPEVRTEIVQRIQNEIRRGEYHPNSREVAEKILDQLGFDPRKG